MTNFTMRSRWAAFGAVLAITLGAGGLQIANATVSTGAKPVLIPITPCRLLDTRPAPDTVGTRSTPIGAAETATFAVRGANGQCNIPAGAVAIATNFTVTNPTSGSFLTVFPADQPRPLASNLNWIGGQPPTPNQVTVKLSATGTIGIYNHAGTVNVLVDIVGYYEDHNHDDRYREETVAANGASPTFLLPPVQLTLGTTTISTTVSGNMELKWIGSGSLNCTTSGVAGFYGWLEVDGVAVRSSIILIGEGFSVAGVDSFSATNFPQIVLQGVTASPVPAGSHQVRARFGCNSGSGLASQSSLWSLVATVLAGTPTVAALTDSELAPGEEPELCIDQMDGTKECRTG